MIDRQIQKALGYYVYGLIDPIRNEIFYVGKGSSNARPYDHLKSSKWESEKAKRIASIRAEHK